MPGKPMHALKTKKKTTDIPCKNNWDGEKDFVQFQILIGAYIATCMYRLAISAMHKLQIWHDLAIRDKTFKGKLNS